MERMETKDNGGISGQSAPNSEQRILNSETAQPDEGTSDGMSPPHKAALEYMRMGWSVIPLHTRLSDSRCSCQDLQCQKPGKHPRLSSWKEYQKRLPTEAEIKTWWTTWADAGVGIICGTVSGNLVVVDIDDEQQATRLVQVLKTSTRLVKTQRRRCHIYLYESASRSQSSELRSNGSHLGELRANGNYVVAPPSPGYTLITDSPPLEVSNAAAWVVETLTRVGIAVDPFQEQKRAYETLKERPLGQGERDSTLTSLAGILRHKGLPTHVIEAALQGVNRDLCQPPLDGAQVQRIAESVSRYPSAQDSDSVAYREMVATERKWRTAREVSQQNTADIRWVWQDYLARGMVTLLSAKPKTGKTTLLFHFLQALIEGWGFFGRSVNCEGKILLCTEEPVAVFKRRMERMGLLLRDDLFIIQRFDVLDWAETLGQLRLAIEQGVSLVVIDTLAEFWGVRDENDAPNTIAAMQQLKAVVQKYDVAALLIHHLRKMAGEDGTAHRGSNALVAAVDIALELYGNPNSPNRRNLKAMSRLAETPAEVIGELTQEGYRYLGAPAAVSRNEVKGQVQAVLPQQPELAKTPEELRDLLNSKPGLTLVKEILGELVKEKHAQQMGEGVKGDRYRFWKADSVSDAPPVYRATENETAATKSADAPGLKDVDGLV